MHQECARPKICEKSDPLNELSGIAYFLRNSSFYRKKAAMLAF